MVMPSLLSSSINTEHKTSGEQGQPESLSGNASGEAANSKPSQACLLLRHIFKFRALSTDGMGSFCDGREIISPTQSNTNTLTQTHTHTDTHSHRHTLTQTHTHIDTHSHRHTAL